jgi:hypothetical protein
MCIVLGQKKYGIWGDFSEKFQVLCKNSDEVTGFDGIFGWCWKRRGVVLTHLMSRPRKPLMAPTPGFSSFTSSLKYVFWASS